MGTPSQRRGLARLGDGSERSLLMRLLRGLPGVDVRDRRRPDAARRHEQLAVERDATDGEAGAGSTAGRPESDGARGLNAA